MLADKALAEVIENSFAYQQAMAHGYRREVDKAFEKLDQVAASLDYYYPTFLLVETAFQSLHSDPRWPVLLQRLGLLEFWQQMERD